MERDSPLCFHSAVADRLGVGMRLGHAELGGRGHGNEIAVKIAALGEGVAIWESELKGRNSGLSHRFGPL